MKDIVDDKIRESKEKTRHSTRMRDKLVPFQQSVENQIRVWKYPVGEAVSRRSSPSVRMAYFAKRRNEWIIV